MIDPVDRIVFSDFYDLIGKKPERKRKTCLRCKKPTIDGRICNKCKKFVDNQPRRAQGDETVWLG